MDANDVLNNLCCGDNHRAWSAGWWIIRATAAELDKLPLASLDTIRAAVMALPIWHLCCAMVPSVFMVLISGKNIRSFLGWPVNSWACRDCHEG